VTIRRCWPISGGAIALAVMMMMAGGSGSGSGGGGGGGGDCSRLVCAGYTRRAYQRPRESSFGCARGATSANRRRASRRRAVGSQAVIGR